MTKRVDQESVMDTDDKRSILASNTGINGPRNRLMSTTLLRMGRNYEGVSLSMFVLSLTDDLIQYIRTNKKHVDKDQKH